VELSADPFRDNVVCHAAAIVYRKYCDALGVIMPLMNISTTGGLLCGSVLLPLSMVGYRAYLAAVGRSKEEVAGRLLVGAYVVIRWLLGGWNSWSDDPKYLLASYSIESSVNLVARGVYRAHGVCTWDTAYVHNGVGLVEDLPEFMRLLRQAHIVDAYHAYDGSDDHEPIGAPSYVNAHGLGIYGRQDGGCFIGLAM